MNNLFIFCSKLCRGITALNGLFFSSESYSIDEVCLCSNRIYHFIYIYIIRERAAKDGMKHDVPVNNQITTRLKVVVFCENLIPLRKCFIQNACAHIILSPIFLLEQT